MNRTLQVFIHLIHYWNFETHLSELNFMDFDSFDSQL